MALIRRVAPDALAAIFAVSGVLHLVRPSFFGSLIPPFLPAPGAIIALSGIAELVGAIGLIRRERWAGPLSSAILIAVLPGNLWFAMDPAGDVRSDLVRVAAWLRLPIQGVLIWAALQSRPRDLDRPPGHGETPNDR